MKALLNWLAPAELRMSDFVVVSVIAVAVGVVLAFLPPKRGAR